MTKRLIAAHGNISNFEELDEAISNLSDELRLTCGQPDPTTVYVEPSLLLTLTEETLTDGSKVYDIAVVLQH